MDNIAYVSLQQESSPFDNKAEDYIELHSLLSQYLKYDEFYNQPLFNDNNLNLFYEIGSGRLNKGCEEIIASQIGQSISDNLNIAQGRRFIRTDFIHCDGCKIPIILGNDYCSVYKLGDTFELEYLYDNYEFEVVGILANNSKLSLNMTYYLDKSIIMPFFIVPDISKLTDGGKIHYANYTSGVVEIPKDRFSTDMKLIKEILKKKICGEYSYAIQQQHYYWKDYLGIDPQTVSRILFVFFIMASMMLICSFVRMSLTLKWSVMLLLLTSIINTFFYVFWTSFGFRINPVYYMMIPIIYILCSVIKNKFKMYHQLK